MPLIEIHTRTPRNAEEKSVVKNAVHSAVRDSLHLLPHDRNVRCIEHAADDFDVPQGRTPLFTLVEITLFAGRSIEAKRALYQGIVRNLGDLGIEAADVMIVLHEEPMENWGIRGGFPASEVDLGFKVDV
jgi:phenylpyruvate tautomerase PptA (4-oxalocrotonate tautomerase family)